MTKGNLIVRLRQFADYGVIIAQDLDVFFEMKQSRWMDWVINAN